MQGLKLKRLSTNHAFDLCELFAIFCTGSLGHITVPILPLLAVTKSHRKAPQISKSPGLRTVSESSANQSLKNGIAIENLAQRNKEAR